MGVMYWGFNAFLLCSDLYGWPRWMAKYKIQTGKNEPVTNSLIFSLSVINLKYFIEQFNRENMLEAINKQEMICAGR